MPRGIIPYVFILSCCLIFTVIATPAKAQDDKTDSLMHAYLRADSLILSEMEADSSSILDFIDSLLSARLSFSSLSFRAGYISNITNAGRDYGVAQYGYSGGLAYYHSSGLFGDVSAYLNSDTHPALNPLVVSIGYMLSGVSKFSVIASYDRYFYFKGDDTLDYYFPFTNSINISPFVDFKHVSIGIDYSFFFGEETAHRIRPEIYGNFSIKKLGFIDQIQFLPGASVFLGNQDVVTQITNIVNLNDYINKVGMRRFGHLYKLYGPDLYQYIVKEEITNKFGIMNYNLSIPVNIYAGDFTLSLSYFYNVPVALPGETIDPEPNSYFSGSVIYSIPFLKR